MEVLQSLDLLEFIDFTVDSQGAVYTSLVEASDLLFGPKSAFLGSTETQHPHLHRILLSTRFMDPLVMSRSGITSLLWERKGTWSSRLVPYLRYWDILCGKLDEV